MRRLIGLVFAVIGVAVGPVHLAVAVPAGRMPRPTLDADMP